MIATTRGSEPDGRQRRASDLEAELADQAELGAARDQFAAAALETEEWSRFELAHRAALRTAGVLIRRNELGARRRPPLNAWEALAVTTQEGVWWAHRFEPYVRLRAGLDPASHEGPDPDLVERHARLVEEFMDFASRD